LATWSGMGSGSAATTTAPTATTWTIGRLLGTSAVALLCVHGAHVQGGGLHARGVAIVPAHLLRSTLGYDRVLSDADRNCSPPPPGPACARPPDRAQQASATGE